MDSKLMIGNLATIFTVGSFFSGVLVCLKIKRKGATGDISVFPFVAGTLCCAVWLRYGMFIEDTALIVVNIIGTAMQFCYVLVYYTYCLNKGSLHRLLLSTGLILVSIALFLMYYPKNLEEAKYTCGLLACTAGIIFSASPLATAAEVIRTKSSETLPLPIIASSLVVCFLWLCYGLILNDPFVTVPNGLGVGLATLQLSLFVVYPSKKARTDLSHLIKS